MAEFPPVTTLEDLESLDPAEVLEGYMDGRNGEPEPGSNRSRSYFHGWRNGRTDAGLAPVDEAQRALVRATTYRRPDGTLVVVAPRGRGRADA